VAEIDQVKLHRLWEESTRVVEWLSALVCECKAVDTASLFGRWLRFSGVLELLEANPQPWPLVVDGKRLRRSVDDLIFECGELYRTGKANARYAQSDIAEINRKLDVIVGGLVEGGKMDDGGGVKKLSEGIVGDL
jgi:hypothetical protein